jgi:hypothetical protein
MHSSMGRPPSPSVLEENLGRGDAPCAAFGVSSTRLPAPSTSRKVPVISSFGSRAMMTSPSRAAWFSHAVRIGANP